MTASTDTSRPAPCPSRRFVLPEEAFYLKNLAALWTIDPKLAAAIEATEASPSYPTQPSRAGPPTVTVPRGVPPFPSPGTPGEGQGGGLRAGAASIKQLSASNPHLNPPPEYQGRREERRPEILGTPVPGQGEGDGIQLHSRYDPVAEARKQIESQDVESHIAFHLHGFGLGYGLELLFDRASDEAIFFVFESDLLLLRTALECRDLARVIASGRVHFFWTLDKADLFVRLTKHGALLAVGCASVEHAASAHRQPDFHKQMRAWVIEFNSYCRTSITTMVLNGRRTAENLTRNLGWYVSAPGIGRLKERYKGFPAVIVSAGPSLRKNKHLLQGLVTNAVIVAVQTTLQPLLEIGVEPHFVTSLDYHEICTRFFEKLPPTLGTELIAEPKATSAIFKLNPGPLSLLGNEFANNMLREMRLEKPTLRAGATVAHLAYYLAEHLGCDPIIFVGQDLGFSDGLCYAPGTSYEDVWRPELSRFCTVEMKQWEQIIRDRPILRKIPDQQGRAMYTEERHFAYLQQFERDFARTPTRIIDATEGGALKRGAAVLTLAEAMRQYCTRPLPAVARDHPGIKPQAIPEALACLGRRSEEAGRIETISRETLPLLEEVRDHQQDQNKVNRTIARIDALRSRMDSLGATYDLITQMTQWTEMRRFEADRLLAASKTSGVDRQRRQALRDIDNVRAVIDAAGEFQRMVEQVIAEISREFA